MTVNILPKKMENRLKDLMAVQDKFEDNEKMRYNPMSKEFQEEAKEFGSTGYQ